MLWLLLVQLLVHGVCWVLRRDCALNGGLLRCRHLQNLLLLLLLLCWLYRWELLLLLLLSWKLQWLRQRRWWLCVCVGHVRRVGHVERRQWLGGAWG